MGHSHHAGAWLEEGTSNAQIQLMLLKMYGELGDFFCIACITGFSLGGGEFSRISQINSRS